jgi:hypothetical protein
VLVALPLASCDRAPTEPASGPAPPGIEDAPATIVADGVTLTIEANTWRDFTPASPSDGSDLRVLIRLRTASGAPLPGGVAADSVWVVRGGLAWAGEPTPTQAPWGPDVLELMMRGGPRWGPDVAVDVVARVTGVPGGPRRIAARQALVERAD